MTIQRWRASNTFTQTQWAAFLADPVARNNFSRGAFALVVADVGGAFVALYQKGQNGNAVGAFVTISPVTSGMTNPMTAVGDMIRGGAAGAPQVLVVGPTGYVLRSAGGNPEWRELSAASTNALRPGAAAVREGQSYWSTDSAVGQQLSLCVHQGGGIYAWLTLPYNAQIPPFFIPDTIVRSVILTGGGSGQSTVEITVTDSNGNPRMGTPIRVQYTSTAQVIYAPVGIDGTQIANGWLNPPQNSAFWLAASNIAGKIKFSLNGGAGAVVAMSITSLSECPATLTPPTYILT